MSELAVAIDLLGVQIIIAWLMIVIAITKLTNAIKEK